MWKREANYKRKERRGKGEEGRESDRPTLKEIDVSDTFCTLFEETFEMFNRVRYKDHTRMILNTFSTTLKNILQSC